jgi:acyl-CoA synthetase (AMP-forming)/AMP-acid ligase II
MLSQGGLAATVVQVVALMGLAPDDVWYQATSLAWSACQLALLGLVNGMTTVLPGGIGSFDITHFLHTIGRHRVSGTMLAPVMIRRVLDELGHGTYDLSSFRKLTYGSSPAPPALVRRVRDALPHVELMQLYGATEGGFVTVLTHTEHLRGFNGEENLLRSCGRPGGWVDMQIMDDDGRPVACGDTGEVWLRSPMNCLGYHRLPDQTEALLAGDWIRSHDIGRMDEEGFLYLTDRKNFMIITGGMNVYPSAVENVLATHPAVQDVAVVGAEHPEWGEAVVAVVELRPDENADPGELVAFCRGRLGAFEVPKFVKIVDTLPRGVTGKVLKAALIGEFVEHPEQLPWNPGQPSVMACGGVVK